MNFKGEDINEYDEMVCVLVGSWSYSFSSMKLDLDMKNWVIPLDKPSIEEPKHKAHSSYHCYAFLGANKTLMVIIATDLVECKVKALVSLLKRFKRDIGWFTTDNNGILPEFVHINSILTQIVSLVLSIKKDLNLPCIR